MKKDTINDGKRAESKGETVSSGSVQGTCTTTRLRRLLERFPLARPAIVSPFRALHLMERMPDGSFPPGWYLLNLLKVTCPQHDYTYANSPQKLILDVLEEPERTEKLQLFERAKFRSQWLCFDLSGQMLFGKDWLTSPQTILDNHLIKQFCFNPDEAYRIAHDSGLLKDRHFLEKMIRERRNWNERTHKIKPPGGALLDIARNWTNPLCPLWMMNNEAGSLVMEFLGKGAMKVSALNFAQIVKRGELVRFGRFPIRDFIQKKTTREFIRFEFSAWVKEKLKV